MDKVFEEALGVEDPWFVRQIRFNKEANRLEVDIDFKKGCRFSIEDGGKLFKINNGILEGLNSVIQTAKRTARGDGLKYFHTMTFLHTGQLNLSRVNPLLPIRFG
jgi:hypothetical protein